jgi:hypothetical protein
MAPNPNALKAKRKCHHHDGIFFTPTQTHSLILDCGGGGIRTPEGFYTLPVFKTGAINRSTTPPKCFFVKRSANIESFEFLTVKALVMTKG